MTEDGLKEKLIKLVEKNGERLRQVQQAKEEHLKLLMGTDPRYQYLLATEQEILNQLNNFQNLMKEDK